MDGISDYAYQQYLSKLDDKAWKKLCEECAGDMHQFDNWEDVPERVKEQYRKKVK